MKKILKVIALISVVLINTNYLTSNKSLNATIDGGVKTFFEGHGQEVNSGSSLTIGSGQYNNIDPISGLKVEFRGYDENGFSQGNQLSFYPGEMAYKEIIFTNEGLYDISLYGHSLSIRDIFNLLEYRATLNDVAIAYNYVEFGNTLLVPESFTLAPGDVLKVMRLEEAAYGDVVYSDTFSGQYEILGGPSAGQLGSLIVSNSYHTSEEVIEITKTVEEIGDGNGVLNFGEQAKYTITYENIGASDVYSFRSYDTLLGRISRGEIQGLTLVGDVVATEINDYTNPITSVQHANSEPVTLSHTDGWITFNHLESGAQVTGTLDLASNGYVGNNNSRTELGDKVEVTYTIQIDDSFDPTINNILNTVYFEDEDQSGIENYEGIEETDEMATQIYSGEGKSTLIPVENVNTVDIEPRNLTNSVDDRLPDDGATNITIYTLLITLSVIYIVKVIKVKDLNNS